MSTFSQNTSTIFEEIKKLKQSFSFENEIEEQQFYRENKLLFAYVSANLFRLMSQIPYSKHKAIFEKLLFNLQLLTIEEQNPILFAPYFNIIDKGGALQKVKQGKPSLFCCFHLGSYSLLPTLLTYRNLDFGFLLNNTLYKRKAETFEKDYQNLCKHINIERKTLFHSTMQLINVEEKKGIWKAIRMLKEGKSLIIYADGNTGSNYSKKENRNTASIDFLQEKLRVRQGIAFLSYVCKIPIVPVVTSRANRNEFSLERKFEFLPAIIPPNFLGEDSENKTSKEEFAVETMQKLYSILEKRITENEKRTDTVSEWEGWIFVNKFFESLQKSILKSNTKKYTKANSNLLEKIDLHYIFNKERFVVIETKKNEKGNYEKTLFDKFTYQFFPVSDLLYEVIVYFSAPKKLYLLDTQKEEKEQNNEKFNLNNHSLVSINEDYHSFLAHLKLQLSETSISVSALEKLIEKEILIRYA